MRIFILILGIFATLALIDDNVAYRIFGLLCVTIGIFILILPFIVLSKPMFQRLLSFIISTFRPISWRDVEKLYDKVRLQCDVFKSQTRSLFRLIIRIVIYLWLAWFLSKALYWIALVFGLGNVKFQDQVIKSIIDNYREIFIWKDFSRCWPITVVVWAVILDIINIVLKALWHYSLGRIRFWRMSKKGKVQCHDVIVDAPIGPDDKDLLGRTEYINVVASIIRGANTRESAKYIGLYGTWGEGKTSVIPRIQRALRYEGYSFVDFRLWEYTDRTRLPRLLFDAIASHERLRLDKTLAGLLRSFGRSLIVSSNAMADLPFIGGILSSFYEFASEHERVKEDLRLALVSHPNKIVVVLDDLDRLLAEDIYELIRLIKANGDLPNVVYLVAADREYLASALASKLPAKASEQEQLEDGRRYLEKIIPIECNLPIVKEARYVGLFKQMLGREIKFPADFDLQKYSADLIAPYLQTMRSVKRLVNAIYVQWMYQCEKASTSKPKIHIEDMISLTAVKIFARPMYESLRRNFYLIQSTICSGGKSSNSGLSRKWVETNLIGGCSVEYHNALLSFMAEVFRFKEVENCPEGEIHPSKAFFFFPLDNADTEFRLMSPKYFWNYYTSENEGAELRPVDINNQFIQLLENEAYAAEYLVTLQAAHKLKTIQKVFYRQLDEGLDLNVVVRGIMAISRAIENVAVRMEKWNFENALQSDFGNLAAAQFFRMFPKCLKKLSATDRIWVKSDAIARYLRKTRCLGTISRIIILYGGRNRNFSKFAFDDLMDYFEGEVEGLFKSKKMVGCPDELAIRKAWICLAITDSGRCRRVAEMLLNEVRMGVSRWNALYPFIKATKSMRADHIAYFTVDWLTKIFELTQLAELSKMIRATPMTTTWEKALSYSIEYIVENNCFENQISLEDQEKYIRQQLFGEKDSALKHPIEKENEDS